MFLSLRDIVFVFTACAAHEHGTTNGHTGDPDTPAHVNFAFQTGFALCVRNLYPCQVHFYSFLLKILLLFLCQSLSHIPLAFVCRPFSHPPAPLPDRFYHRSAFALPGSRAYLERGGAGRAGAVSGQQEPGRVEVRPYRPSYHHVRDQQGVGGVAQGGCLLWP